MQKKNNACVRKFSKKLKELTTDTENFNNSLIQVINNNVMTDRMILEKLDATIAYACKVGFSIQQLQTFIKSQLGEEISVAKIRRYATEKGYVSPKKSARRSAPVTKPVTTKVEQKKEEVNDVNKLKNDMDQLQAIELGDTKSI